MTWLLTHSLSFADGLLPHEIHSAVSFHGAMEIGFSIENCVGYTDYLKTFVELRLIEAFAYLHNGRSKQGPKGASGVSHSLSAQTRMLPSSSISTWTKFG